MLVQVSKHSGEINRVPRGQTPIIELELEPHHRIVECRLEQINPWSLPRQERKTVDWKWEAMIAAHLVDTFVPDEKSLRGGNSSQMTVEECIAEADRNYG